MENKKFFQSESKPSHMEEQQAIILNSKSTILQHVSSDSADQSNSTASNIKRRDTIENMEKDWSSMPECAERSIIYLIYLAVKQISGATESETTINNEFANAKNHFSSSVAHSFHFVNIAFVSADSKILIFSALSNSSIEKVESTASQIKGKDIILLLGGIGSGISTTIHWLAGSEMKEVSIDGITYINAIRTKDAALNDVIISPSSVSQTRYITAISVNYEDSSVILCDTPGFGETRGPEVDIANVIGIVKAVKGCKSVKPVILISRNSLQYNGIRVIAQQILGMIPDIRDHIPSFSYLFTKFSGKDKKEIHAKLNEFQKNMNLKEKSDQSFAAFVKDMAKKTRNHVMTVDPLNDKPVETLDALQDTVSIQSPSEAFRFNISGGAGHALNDQVNKTRLAVMSAAMRFDYPLVNYKLDELKSLSALPEVDYIKEAYDECIRNLTKSINNDHEQSTLT